MGAAGTAETSVTTGVTSQKTPVLIMASLEPQQVHYYYYYYYYYIAHRSSWTAG